jgi:hypothetical protein
MAHEQIYTIEPVFPTTMLKEGPKELAGQPGINLR